MSQPAAPLACRPVRQALDAYLSAELEAAEIEPVETHLSQCVPCATECRARRRLRHELAAALAPDWNTGALEERVVAALEAEAGRGVRRRFAGLVAALAAGLVLLLFAGRERKAPSDATIYDETSHAHLMCAVRGEFPGPAAGRAQARLGLERFAPVLAALEPELAAGAVLDAHVCRWPRPFGHVVLERNGHRVSLLVTPERSEALPAEGLLLPAPGRASVRGLERGGFRLAASAGVGHAVFVVSDLDAPEVAALGVRVLPLALQGLGAPEAGPGLRPATPR